MRSIRKLFYRIVAIVVVPIMLLIGVILYSHFTGKTIDVPWAANTTESFLTTARIHSVNVFDSTGKELIGKRGFIEVGPTELSTMTPSQYYNYYVSTLRDSDYLWFTFVCPDGTGLYIPNVADGGACYCTIDSMGRVVSPKGFLIIEGESCYYSENNN